jgi:hypothetical protein
MEVKVKYEVEIKNRFGVLESLEESSGINNASEIIKDIIKTEPKII